MQEILEVPGSTIATMIHMIGDAGIKLDLNDTTLPNRLIDLAKAKLGMEDVDAHLAALRTLFLFDVVGKQHDRLKKELLFDGNSTSVVISPALYAAVGQAPLQIDPQGFHSDAADIVDKAVALRDQLRK